MTNLKVQSITLILSKAGFLAAIDTCRNYRDGYRACQLFGNTVGIDCCGCIHQLSAIAEALKASPGVLVTIDPRGVILVRRANVSAVA
jgi:hypothetical protein